MGRGGDALLKAEAKRIKAKGLQKLRWYCQMCEKQCRDENGFKCHCESASHQRKLEEFSQDPSAFIEKFSRAFQKDFLEILRNRFGTKMIKANTVYQEYIKDKQHVHMNATKWLTLGEFVKFLGRESICKVQEKEGVWFLAYLDREVGERYRRAREIEQQRLAEEERADKMLQERMRAIAAKENGKDNEIEEEQEEHQISASKAGDTAIAIKAHGKRGREEQSGEKDFRSIFDTDAPTQVPHDWESPASSMNGANKGPVKKRSRWSKVQASSEPVKEIIMNDESEGDHWLMKELLVKVVNKKVGGGVFYKKKGVVTGVEDIYTALLEMRDSGAVLRIDQDDLETVIPKPGKRIAIVKGKYRAQRGTLERIDVSKYTVSVMLDSGKRLSDADYESVCRYNSDEG